MKKTMKIDIAKNVMNEINAGKVTMRSRLSFVLQRYASIVGIILLILVATTTVASLVFVLHMQMFSEYFEFGRAGTYNLLKSIPWLGVILTVAMIAVGYMLIKSVGGTNRTKYIGALASLLLIFGVGIAAGMSANTNSTVSKIANSYRLGSQPQKINGVVEQISEQNITINSNGVVKSVKINSKTLYKNQTPEVGDEVLILAEEKNGEVSADAIKVTARVQKQTTESKTEVATSEVVGEQPKTEVPTETPKPKPTVNTPTPNVSSTPSVVNPVGKVVSITGVSAKLGGGPTYKYQISYGANFSSPSGYKLVWALAPAVPAYPGSSYDYNTNPSGGSGYVKNNLGAGTYNVRVCEYLGGVCGVYSPTIQVTF